MVNRSRTPRVTPPHVSFKSWETFFDRARMTLNPMPQRLDTNLWASFFLSGSTRSAIQGCLLFLGLTDDRHRTTERMKDLFERATSDDDRRRIQRALVDESYGPILGDIDLERAARQDIRMAFQRAGTPPDKLEKAVAFFVSFARLSGVEFHALVKPRQTVARSRRRNAGFGHGDTDAPPTERDPQSTPRRSGGVADMATPMDGLPPALAGLIAALPRNGSTWSPAAQRNSFKIAWDAAFDLAYPPTHDTDPGQPSDGGGLRA